MVIRSRLTTTAAAAAPTIGSAIVLEKKNADHAANKADGVDDFASESAEKSVVSGTMIMATKTGGVDHSAKKDESGKFLEETTGISVPNTIAELNASSKNLAKQNSAKGKMLHEEDGEAATTETGTTRENIPKPDKNWLVDEPAGLGLLGCLGVLLLATGLYAIHTSSENRYPHASRFFGWFWGIVGSIISVFVVFRVIFFDYQGRK